MTLTQAVNSLGTTIAPLLGSLLILSTPALSTEQLSSMAPAALEAYRATQASSVQTPYLGLAILLSLLALTVARFRLPEIDADGGPAVTWTTGPGSNAWQYRHLVLGAVAIFAYVGGEVAIGSFLVSYFKEPYVAGLSEAEGARYVSLYWGGAMAGRFLGAATLQMFRPHKVLAVHALGAGTLVVLTMLTTGPVAMWTIIGVGLFNSIMFPTIFTVAIAGLGKHTAQGSGILCMAIVGGAVVPVLQGLVADEIGIRYGFIVPVLCYLYVAWYGATGHRQVGRPV